MTTTSHRNVPPITVAQNIENAENALTKVIRCWKVYNYIANGNSSEYIQFQEYVPSRIIDFPVPQPTNVTINPPRSLNNTPTFKLLLLTQMEAILGKITNMELDIMKLYDNHYESFCKLEAEIFGTTRDKKYKKLKRKIRKLEKQITYMPHGTGYEDAKHEFEQLSSDTKS